MEIVAFFFNETQTVGLIDFLPSPVGAVHKIFTAYLEKCVYIYLIQCLFILEISRAE